MIERYTYTVIKKKLCIIDVLIQNIDVRRC